MNGRDLHDAHSFSAVLGAVEPPSLGEDNFFPQHFDDHVRNRDHWSG